jgi:hypothetical protein
MPLLDRARAMVFDAAWIVATETTSKPPKLWKTLQEPFGA